VAFEDHCVKTNNDRLMLSGTKMFNGKCSFWRRKVYSDIRGVSRKEASNDNEIMRISRFIGCRFQT